VPVAGESSRIRPGVPVAWRTGSGPGPQAMGAVAGRCPAAGASVTVGDADTRDNVPAALRHGGPPAAGDHG